MAVTWTEEQKQVISLKGADILVAAAAGSGKTAVLVQRIIEKVMDEKEPVNIDQMVIVTFTQAAAGEMRERIQAAIEKQAALHPENEHLQRQLTRIHMANISTIHSFCKMVIGDHFQEIQLEPTFRIGDSSEIKLLQKDVLGTVLEKAYEEQEPDFLALSESVSDSRSDEKLEEIVIQLYEFAISYPDPKTWLHTCEQVYRAESYEEIMDTDWMRELYVYLEQMLAYVEEKNEEILEEINGYSEYMEVFMYYNGILRSLRANMDYEHWYHVLENVKTPMLPRGKKAMDDSSLRSKITVYRDEIKETLAEWKKNCFVQRPEELLEDLRNCRPVMTALIRLTIQFMEQFKEEKRSRNIMDFSDLEHEALKVLVDEEGEPTEAAREYAAAFYEILIDEYQDSNLLQETLLQAVSKKCFGEHNIFMVGDPKQSIYRFRLARPELFMEKFYNYSMTDGKQRRIDLHKNFRSRKEVLDSVNYIFERIMKDSLGGIQYDKAAALDGEMEYEYPCDASMYQTEILLYEKPEKELDMTALQYEAKVIAQRIKELVSPETGLMIQDKTEGCRRAQYRDIAIIARGLRGFDTVLMDTLASEGIPVYAVSREGYFNAIEIATILNYLRIVDNPMQDIPLLTVLKSPMGGFDDKELAEIRIGAEEGCMYECCIQYTINGESDCLKEKLTAFLNQLERYRRKVFYMPLHKLLCLILEETGYNYYIQVMPGGTQRKANMDMLLEKAREFEKTSYLGIFQFLRYIEQLEKYKVEMGEANIIDENANVVRVMTIHKSKGLEFPIVFVAGCGRKFNMEDAKKALAIHSGLGIAIDNVRLDVRQKNSTVYKKTCMLKNRLETMGEELRVLYVAMTRAREKLIMTGNAESIERIMQKAYYGGGGKNVPFGYLSTAKSYLDWIMAAVINHKDMQCMWDTYLGSDYPRHGVVTSDYGKRGFVVRNVEMNELMEKELLETARENRLLLNFEMERRENTAKLPKQVLQALQYKYPYESQRLIPVKMSVSELKKEGMILDEEEARLIEEKEKKNVVPAFLKTEDTQISAVRKGTMYHKAFECLDLEQAGSLEDVKKQIDHLFETGVLDKSMNQAINPWKLFNFAKSSIGKRMKLAAQSSRIYKEQPFVYGIPAGDVKAEWKSDRTVLIQGIVDAYFEEDGQIVIVDYKTDYVKAGEEQKLADKYRVQMEYYKKALETMTDKPVKECILYSVYLDKEVPVK